MPKFLLPSFVNAFQFFFTGVYVLSTFVLSVLAVCFSVLVLNLHGRQGEPVPVWLQRAFTSKLCACLASRKRGWDGKVKAYDPRGKRNCRKTGPAPEIISGEKTELEDCAEFPIEVYQGSDGKEREKAGVNVTKTTPGKLDLDIDWQTVAQSFDRAFFWSFLIICMLVCLTVVTLWVSH